MTHDLAASGFGIEEEFFLLDASDLDIVRSAPPDSSRPAVTRSAAFRREMFECQVEVASPVFSTLAEAALPRSGPATPGASGHGLRPALALRRHPSLRRLAAGAQPGGTLRPPVRGPGAGGPAQPGLRPARACGDTAEPRPHGCAPARVAVAAAAAGVERILAVPRRPAQRPGELSTGTLRQWPRMNIPPALPDGDAYRRHLALLREPAASARWPGLVDDPAVIPCADPGAAYLRRLPAPGRRAEPGRAVQGRWWAKRWARTRVRCRSRATPAWRKTTGRRCVTVAPAAISSSRCVGAGDWLEMAWRQCRPQAARQRMGLPACLRVTRRDLRRSPVAALPEVARSGPERHPALRRLVEELLEENLQPALAD